MAVVALLLIVCAALQWNDPDPLRWIAFYAGSAVAVFGLRYATGKLHATSRWSAILIIAIAMLATGMLIATQLSELQSFQLSQVFEGMSNAVPGNELAKELGGLLFTACVLGLALRLHSKRA